MSSGGSLPANLSRRERFAIMQMLTANEIWFRLATPFPREA